jgi:hypothetical protein
VKFGLDARSIASDLEGRRGAWTDADIARDHEGHSNSVKAVVFGALGGAALIGGGYLYLRGHKRASSAERLRLEARATTGGATASVVFDY